MLSWIFQLIDWYFYVHISFFNPLKLFLKNHFFYFMYKKLLFGIDFKIIWVGFVCSFFIFNFLYGSIVLLRRGVRRLYGV